MPDKALELGGAPILGAGGFTSVLGTSGLLTTFFASTLTFSSFKLLGLSRPVDSIFVAGLAAGRVFPGSNVEVLGLALTIFVAGWLGAFGWASFLLRELPPDSTAIFLTVRVSVSSSRLRLFDEPSEAVLEAVPAFALLAADVFCHLRFVGPAPMSTSTIRLTIRLLLSLPLSTFLS